MTQSIVFMSYNVHMWTDDAGMDNSDRVSNLIRDHQVDIACLNEVVGGFRLQHVLSEYRSHYVHADYNFGNSCSVRTASRLRYEKSSEVTFDPPEDAVYWSEGRSAVRTSLHWPTSTAEPTDDANNIEGFNFDIYCTHLDHRTEETRLLQLDALLRKVDFQRPHIICGDFNALCESDYSPKYMARIAEVRRRGNWETPKFDVVNKMKHLGYVDAFDRLLPDTKDQDRSSCRFGTRIDYVWISQSFAEKIDWAQSSASLVGGMISDHRAVLLKLHLLKPVI